MTNQPFDRSIHETDFDYFRLSMAKPTITEELEFEVRKTIREWMHIGPSEKIRIERMNIGGATPLNRYKVIYTNSLSNKNKDYIIDIDLNDNGGDLTEVPGRTEVTLNLGTNVGSYNKEYQYTLNTDCEQITWSPARNTPMPNNRMAAMPVAVATAVSVPSSAARRISMLVTVGLPTRV